MPFPVAAAITAGATLAGQGMGMANAAARNKKQLRNQKELMKEADQYNRSMAIFNNEQQMKMWEATGPTGQMRELKEAGLNPGLIYGMGGAGGQTAQAAQGQGQHAPQAPTQESGAEMGAMGLQLAAQLNLMKAQKENIEADTKNKLGDAANKPLTGANIQADTELKRLNVTELEGTIENRIALVATATSKAFQELRIAQAQGNIADVTQESQIDQITQEAIGAMLNNTLTISKNDEIKAKIAKMSADIAQGWKGLDQQEQKIRIDQQLANIKAEFPDLDNVMARDIRAGLDKLWQVINPHMPRPDNYKQHNPK